MKQCTDCGRSEGSKATFLRVTASDKCDECLRIYEAKASRAYYAEHKAEKIARQRAVRLADAARPVRVCKPVTRPAACHPDRQRHSKGLCGTCYNADLLRRRLAGEPARSEKVAACHPGRPHKAKGLCEECYRAEWVSQSPERKRQSRAYVLDNADDLKIAQRIQNLKTCYGLSALDHLIMVQNQSCRCAICGQHMTSPHVDHDHATGAVRELLCAACNRGIGSLMDSPGICRSAARYLEKHGRQ
jgi:hypothetical protein